MSNQEKKEVKQVLRKYLKTFGIKLGTDNEIEEAFAKEIIQIKHKNEQREM